jgi:diaminobutyrate-2-oxoglutarate transaminase
MDIFNTLESEVRSYCRSFPVVFAKALASTLIDERGNTYIDCFSGAGALNYGHNNPRLKRRLIEYLRGDGVTHSLDMATSAKREFLRKFDAVILRPRGLSYKCQFTGPTGTNAVEAALKLARKITKRTTVFYFRNAFHGMTLGSLSVTGSLAKRTSAGVPLQYTLPLPFESDLGAGIDSLDYLLSLLDSKVDGTELPAAIIVETIQAEGGVRVASFGWLQRLEEIARRFGIVLIVDDIQVGCGRTGTFFSFEPAGVYPDIVCLSKSISGFGLPMSLVLIKPEMDIWKPGEHNGTFRGNNLAFVTATEALTYWEDERFSNAVGKKSRILRRGLEKIAATYPGEASVRGRGLIQGIEFSDPGIAKQVSLAAFQRGLIVETAGPRDEVLKLLPPLVISASELEVALEKIGESLEEIIHLPLISKQSRRKSLSQAPIS